MKRLLLSLFSILVITGLSAQDHLEQVICTTGGTFLGPDNKVKLYAFETAEDETNVVAEFLGDFSNDVVRDGRFAYTHVGRAFGNPAGMDVIYKVDLTSGEVVDSLVDIPGAAHLLIYDDLLMVGKGFGAQGENVEFFNKNDLSQESVFQGAEVGGGVGGYTILDEKIYLSFTEADTGRIAVYDMASGLPEYDSTIALDTLSKGMGDLITDGESIFAFSNFTAFDDDFNVIYNFSSVAKVDPNDGSFTTGSVNSARGALVIAPNPIDGGNIIIANFGSDGNFLDTNTLQPLGLGFLPFYTAGVADGVNQFLWVQVTDFSSFGSVSAYNTLGEEVRTFDTDISGSALDLVTNNAPIAVDDTFQGAFVTTKYDVLENDSDPDGEEIKIVDLVNVSGGSVSITEDNRVEATFDEGSQEITFTYVMSDIWNRQALADVTIANFTSVDGLIITDFGASPNPATDKVQVNLESFENEAVTLTLFALDGQVLQVTEVGIANFSDIDLSDLGAGLYILEARSASRQGRVKLVKN